ncbi:MAG: hypothetical protein CBC73_05355 [Flavobacteriales bacterium TMED113]|nr:MAG: hypothetical protein CBC73_05355 [Flavobacteriales bacterium TMED113]
MQTKNINVSDRVENQLPEFIRQEDRQLVNFLFEYYKSQEKTGRPYDILNNLLNYLNLDNYNSKTLSSSTLLLSEISTIDTKIEIESIDGFVEKNGSIMIDNEVIYYESVTRGPDAIITPGVSYPQFNKKKQQLENPFLLFDGVRREFPLSFLGTPVAPPSAQHLIVITYNDMLTPDVDYTINGSNLVFTVAPRARSGADDSEFTQVTYLVGYADQPIITLDDVSYTEWQGTKNYPLRVNDVAYSPTSDIGLVIQKNGRLQQPYVDYTVFETTVIFKNPIGAADEIDIRSVEYIAPVFGSGASAVVAVNAAGQVSRIIPKTGGEKYRLDFNPKVIITSNDGSGATVRSLIGGIKNINLIDGGQGYNSYNPPIPVVATPTDPNGTAAVVSLTVDDETGTVDSITIDDSGSGYSFIPSITFKNPSGATISPCTIDSEGRVNVDSISVLTMGSGYSNPPTVYIDPAPADGINAQAQARINQDGQVYEIQITNRGRGYVTAPRVAIIDPVGAQVLDVTVASGSVTNIEMLTGGSGYNDAPSVYIVDDRKDGFGEPIGGIGATAAATIFNGEITDINITNFGSGYSTEFPPKIFIAEPKAARASLDVGFDEVTGYDVIEPGIGYSPSAFLECSRGVSGAVTYDNYHNEVYASEANLRQSNHLAGAVVANLDSLFIKEVFDKFRRQYLPTLDIDFSKVDPVQVIKNISDFYISKGTELATQYLFKILFGENVSLFYPRDEIISPSNATWVVDTVLRAELISGDPANLIDSQVVQYADAVDLNIKQANALIENVITIIEGTDTIYELAISEETLVGLFKIPYKTTLVEPLSTDGQIITVDSTIGWPERNGTILINDVEQVQYKEKSLNQFIECTRSKNNVVEDWDPGTIVQSDIFVYTNFGTDTECKMRILGIAEAGTTILNDTGSYYLKGDKLKVANLGATDIDERLTSWLYNVKKLIQVTSATPGGVNNQTATIVCDNPHGLLVSDQVTIYGANPVVYNGTFTVTARLDDFSFSYQLNVPTEIIPEGNILLSVDLNRGKSDITSINNVVSEFTTNIQNSFFNDQYAYIAASGLPNYKIGPFTGSALIPGNQRKLLRFPRIVETISERQDIAANSPIGTWINGVSIWGYKSGDFVQFGPLTQITVDNSGEGYDAGAKPTVEINGGGGTGAAAEVIVNGSLTGFDVTAGGSGYTESPLVSIVGGNGSGATAQAVITGGRVTRILVEQGGQNYTTQPTVSITGGGGTGATATASVRGSIQSVNITNFGTGYTSLPTIKVNSGEGALAQAIVINGRIVSIAIINSGSGYTTSPTVIINGDGFGAIAKATIGTIGEDKGRVLGIVISNRGIGYTQGNTTIRLEAVGQLAEFTPEVFKWNKNLEYELASKYDNAKGYVFTGYNNQFGGEYAHLSDPKELRYVVGDNVFLNPVTQQFQELESNFQHSPILGWAFDGNPIYGPYGYIDPTDQNSGIRRLRTSYKLKANVVYDEATNPNPSRVDGPLISEYAAGTFVADYFYDFQSGDLDNYNGRFCKTPEYPDGTYAYFITIDASDTGVPEYPYILGPQFNSLPDNWNFTQGATQENIPDGVVRFRDPYVNVDIDVDRQPNQEADVLTTEIEGYPIIFEVQDSNNDGIIDANEQQEILEMSEEATLQIYDYFPRVSAESRVDIEVETTTQFESAQIDGFVIENPGESYQVNDTVFFDDTDTGGFGASAIIESVKGNTVMQYTKEIIGDRPYGVITTDIGHELRAQDEIIVNSTPVIDNTNKLFKVKVVAGIESLTVDTSGTGYNADIPPTFELITASGQDAQLRINLLNTGNINTVDIINSGNGYDTANPPQIRISHPQQFNKTRYWLAEYFEASANVEINDIQTTEDRFTYICGTIVETDGDQSGFLAKFDDLGQKVWERYYIPQNQNQKKAEFIKMYLDTSYENDCIYVTGQTYDPQNSVYNPDVWLAKFESGFNNANNPDGILEWQKAIAGISGSTRRDYITTIALDQEKRIYIGGYTDSNSPDPNDMWIIQCDIDGNLVEKRKIASEDGSEEMTQVMWVSNDRFFFTGVNDENNDLIFGEIYYDGANIEIDYIRQMPAIGGYVRNPKFVKDNYGDIILIFDVYNNATSKTDKIQINKFAYATAKSSWEWAKTLTLSNTTFRNIHHSGITVDAFGNYTVVTDVDESENNRYSVITYMKYNGTILTETKVDDTATVGFKSKGHSVDNSGDPILAIDRQVPNQLASFRFNDDSNLTFDHTKLNKGTWQYVNQSEISVDTNIYKFGTGSMKINSAAPVAITNLNTVTVEWSTQAWFAMDTTTYATNHKPILFHILPTLGSELFCELDGDSTSPGYGKVYIHLNNVQVAGSTAATYWTGFGGAAWNHVLFQKRQESLGLYKYEVYINGNLAVEYQSTTDVSLSAITVGGPSAAPSSANCYVGHVDDLVIDDVAPYSATFSAPAAEIPITMSNSDAALLKFDRLHSKAGTYTMSGLTNHTNYAFTDITANTLWSDVNIPAISVWEVGPGGLQILDMSQTVSTLTNSTYTLTADKYEYGTKTSTIPSPQGRQLQITANVVNKFYLRDALYQKIDNVREFTFTQGVKLTKGSILQQFNAAGITSAYATIVDVPEGTLLNPGFGTKYKIGKAYGNFNNTDRFRTTANDVNQITGTYFDTIEEEDPWQSGVAYNTGDRVYNGKRIYAAQGAGTSGSISPVHTTGVVSDGVINWAFIDDAGKFTVDLTQHPYPRPQYLGSDMPEWVPGLLYATGQRVWYKLNVYQVAVSGGGVAGTTAPIHTTGDDTDGGVTWTFVETIEAISLYTRVMPYDMGNNYSVRIEAVQPGSTYIPGDVVSLNSGNITLAADEKSVEISGFAGVKKIRVTARLEKDIIRASEVRTEFVYATSNSPHNFKAGDILFTEGFQGNQFNGSFFIDQLIGSREFTFAIRETALDEPAFVNNAIARVNIYGKHPTLEFTRNHQYVFDVSDVSNFGYYLSFSQDNQYKLEYSFNNIERVGTPGIDATGSNAPFVKFSVLGEVTNISYYFDPSRLGADSPVGENSFIDVITTPFQGTFTISEIVTDFQFKFPLLKEPERASAEIITDEFDNPYTFYSTTSTRAVGPINSIKLVSPGGFYQRLPIISDIASFRQIEKIVVTDGGTEYAPGNYYDVPINGDGEGGKASILVELDDEVGSGTIRSASVTDPGKGYTTATVDIDAIPGILGSTLAGSGGAVNVIIPSEGSGASVFLTGRNIGKIKRLKNNEFGFGYSHDYTLKPEITFPVNLQLFNTSILAQIKITNPGSGYSSVPAVIIEGGGGTGAAAEAIIKNNRLSEIIIKNPGGGYSSEPTVTLKSEFNYVVNLDLNYLQFNFPHGITTGAEVQFRADNVGSTTGELPKPSSAGLTSLVAGQTYYAIAGEAAGLETDQLRFGLTLQSAQGGDYITFLTQGSGRQTLLTEVFGGQAVAVVETSRFLEGEEVYQGSSPENATAVGTVSTNTGWQIGPKILKIVDYTGDWTAGERVTGQISKAAGVIDNLSIARGVLNIGSLTRTPGRFIDDVGKPSEIVQKIQDSYFYQNFSYVVKSQIPITEWKTQVLENNHPAGFNMFGQLELTGGKDISGRNIGTEFTKQVNINNYSNVNEITSFGAAQPIYTDYNNTEVLFRKRRLTSSEEILTSIVKKMDDISGAFNGIDKQFPITVEGEQVIVQNDQLLITLNGVVQSPGESYQVVGGNIVFAEPPKPPSKVNYRTLGVTTTPIYRIALYDSNGTNEFGIFPTLGQQVQGEFSDTFATVIDSGLAHIDVINVTGGTFQLNEEIVRGELFSALIQSVTLLNTETIFEFGESITNLEGDTAIIEETNVDTQGVISDRVVVSKTSGTPEFETGIFDLRLNEYIYSAKSKIAGQITFIAPYEDPATNDVVDELIINPGSTFFGLLFERLVSITNPNVIVDDISKSSITPTELYDASQRINDDFLDFEQVRSTEVVYTGLSGGTISAGDVIINKRVDYNNPNSSFHGTAENRFKDASAMILGNKQEIIDFADAQIAVEHPYFYFPGDVITNPWSRYSDAYRLIQLNKDYIAAVAYDEMITQYPSLTVSDPGKCIRDLHYYIDAVSVDIFRGGNVYTRKLSQDYFDASGNFVYVNNESAETRYGFTRAKEWMKLAIINNITANYTASSGSLTGITFKPHNEIDEGGYDGHGITADPSPNDDYGTAGANTSNNGTDNCSDVQAAITTLHDIVDTTLTNGNLTELPDETVGTYTTGQTKCRRDIGLMIDAVAEDVSNGGNYNTVEFTKKYFNADGSPISNGLTGEEGPSISAITKARDLMFRAINNLLYYKRNATVSETGYMLKDPTTYAGPYTNGSTELEEKDVTGATYNSTTGIMTLTLSGGHSWTTADSVTVRPYSIRFTCSMDNDETFHDYPRAGDPAFNTPITISGTGATTIDLDVGSSPLVSHTPTGATYDPSTGMMVLTIGAHNLSVGEYVKLDDDSITFTCAMDDNATNHSYPRNTDPASNVPLQIIARTDTTIKLFVAAQNSEPLYTHTFVSATTGAVKSGGGYTHTFISALPNAVFLGGGSRAEYFDPNYASGRNQSIQNCANVQAYIATLADIATTAISHGDLDNVNALASITDGTFVDGETIRTIKLAYQNKSSGLFVTGDQIKGMTSGAVTSAIGINTGLKWIFSGAITGTFQAGEFITNSTLSNTNCTTSVIERKTTLVGSQSVRIPSNGYLAAADSYDFTWGTADFTLETWFRPDAVSGTQHIFDFRRTSAATGLRVYLDGSTIRVANGTSTLVSGGTVQATVWQHLAVVRSTGVITLYLNGNVIASAADTNNYLYAPAWVGTSFQQSLGFTGYIDLLCMRRGEADYTATFSPPSQIDYTRQNISLGIDGEQPFILSTTECYATFTGQRSSNATARKVDYGTDDIIIKDVDLGRASYRDAAGIISLNAEWIAEEAVGYMQAQFPDFTIPGDTMATQSYGGTSTCIRDTKDYILSALVKDLADGGNYNTLYTARTYLEVSGKLKHVQQEILQTLYTWDYAATLCNEVITTTSTDLTGTYTQKLRIPNNFTSPASTAIQNEVTTLMNDILEVLAPTGDRFRDGGVAIWKNRDYIAEETVGYIQNKYTQTIDGTEYDYLVMPGYGEPYCLRDLKDHILPAVISDLATGGTYNIENVVDQYLDGQENILHVENELNPMLDAFAYAEMLAEKAVNQLLLSPGETASSLGFPAQYQDDYHSPVYTARGAYRDDTVTIDTEGYPQVNRNANDRFVDAVDAIQANKRIIAQEAVEIMNDMSKYSALAITGGAVNCVDDVVDILDAVSHDLLFDCNEKIYDASALYVETENNSLKHIESEWEASITTFKIARDIAILAFRNGFGRDYVEGNEPDTTQVQSYEQNPRTTIYQKCGDAIDANIRYIAENAVALGRIQYPSLSIPGGPINCVHDVTDLLRAMVFNLKYGGDNYVQYGAEFYVGYGGSALIHVNSQSTETLWIFNKAKDLAIRAMKDQIITDNAGYGYQRFYNAVLNPTTALVDGGGINGNANLLLTRTIHQKKNNIDVSENSSSGVDPTEDSVFSVVTVIPSTAVDACLFELGGAAQGVWVGFRDGGTYFRIRAGNSNQSYSGGATYTTDSGLAMLDIPIGDITEYMDDEEHEITWEIKIGGDLAVGKGSIRAWIDGNYMGQATTPGGINDATGLGAGAGLMSDTGDGGFAATNGTVANSEPTALNTFTVNVGSSPKSTYDVSGATYDPATGEMVLNIGNHDFRDTSLLTTTGATYDPATGLMVLTSNGHGIKKGDRVIVKDITFTCAMDGGASNHTYPRTTDPYYNKMMIVSAADANTFTINVGVAGATGQHAHTWVSNTNNNIIHSTETVRFLGESINFTCTMDSNQTTHAYPRVTDWAYNSSIGITGVGSTAHTPSTATYDAATGDLGLTLPSVSGFTAPTNISPTGATYDSSTGDLTVVAAGHGVTTGGKVKFVQNAFTFTCTMDNNATQHSYPRTTDPWYDQWILVKSYTADTFTVNVGVAAQDSRYTHAFISAASNGVARANTMVEIAPDGVTFTCTQDGNNTNHSYPRADDPAIKEWLPVESVVGNVITVDVGASQQGQQYPHTFVSALTGAVKKQDGTLTVHIGASPAGQQYPHTFVNATSGALITGGGYVHRFVSADSNAIQIVGGAQLTPTNAYYTPETGELTFTVAGHTLTTANKITIAPQSLTMSCSSDQFASQHVYPRPHDPVIDSELDVIETSTWAWPIKGELEYYRNRLVSEEYTGTEGDEVETEVTSLMAIFNDTLTNPSNILNRSYTLPFAWPVKYTPDLPIRDLTVTYDSSNGGEGSNSSWNLTCPEVVSALNTLMEIPINTIIEAATNNVNYLTGSVTKTFPYNSNTNYQGGTCYNVTSAVDTLMGLLSAALGGGTQNDQRVANQLLFNTNAIEQRAYDQTVSYYGTTNATLQFATDVMKAVRYDMITMGNAGSFRLLQDWFDGEGNFIAYQDVTRSHLIYYLTRIREYMKSVLYDRADTGWTGYPVYIPSERLEYNQEAAEFIMDSSLNPIEYALELSKFPTEASVTWIPSTDAENLGKTYQMGIDYNTDPALVVLTPTVDVGFDRAEYRVRVNRANQFRRGDILTYIPASQTSVTAFTTQPYWYVMTATAQWFEIGAHYIHDGRHRNVTVDTNNSGSQIFSVVRRSGITRTSPVFPSDPSETPIQGGFNPADVIYGSTSDATAEIGTVFANESNIRVLMKYYGLSTITANFVNGENVVVSGATSNTGKVIQTVTKDADSNGFVKLIDVAGTINVGDTIEGTTSGATGVVTADVSDRMLINVEKGDFNTGDYAFNKENAAEVYFSTYTNKSGSLTDTEGGRITIDVETISNAWDAGDVVYGSVTDYILDVKGLSGTQIQLNQYIHGRAIYELTLGPPIVDTGVNDTFNVGDQISLLQGTTQKSPGWTATVTQYINGLSITDSNDPNYQVHKLWIGNLIPVGAETSDISEVSNPTNNIGKIELGSNFPTIYTNVVGYTATEYSAYGKVVAIEQAGINATIWVEDAQGEFLNNMSVQSDYGWGGAVSSARTLEGRVDRYFRGFDGTQTTFDLTINNGEAYFPDPAGHLLVYVNGILQPPGGNASYVAFSDKIQYNEAPDIGSEFIGYYVGKLRQLDDISFEFDSLRSSFNLKRGGLFYSLTLTEGVSSNTILPENNIIVSLNGIIQEPGTAYELVGSRIIFAETPRAGSTFVGFSYIGSDADVIAATVVPPIESGDNLLIEGEEFAREVALIESSNSLITFEYTGSVKGRNAAALATVTRGQITNAILTNPGDGYDSRPNVDVISSSGFDANIKALTGITRIDVKSAGVGYSMPSVLVETEVPDDFVEPTGTPVNGGFDILAGEGSEYTGGTTITEGTIAITQDPTNVTVNQGQTASFTVVSTVTNTSTMNYQWQKKEYGTQTWSNIIGANQATYFTNATTQADDSDEYRVAITAAGATPVYSLSAVLSVQTGATVITGFTPNQIFDDI